MSDNFLEPADDTAVPPFEPEEQLPSKAVSVQARVDDSGHGLVW